MCQDISCGNDFLDLTVKAKATEAKINKVGYSPFGHKESDMTELLNPFNR